MSEVELSESEVRLNLQRDEATEAANGNAPIHATSATAFIVAGLQLEHDQ